MSEAPTTSATAHVPEMVPPVFRFGTLDGPLLKHGIAGRAGGVSRAPFDSLNLSVKTGDDRGHVEQNRRRFESLMGFETRQSAFGRLTHGSEVTTFKVGAFCRRWLRRT